VVLDNSTSLAQRSKSYDIYLHRTRVHWAPYNESVTRRFWVAGTSLRGIVEGGLVTGCLARGIEDIKIVLPGTCSNTIAYHQLNQFDLQVRGNLMHNQVRDARVAYKRLSARIFKASGGDRGKYLRTYNGIMYANITVFDDEAFLAPYDATGEGDSSPTLHASKHTSPEAYRYIENVFLRMWDAEALCGQLPTKGAGCSLILQNSSGDVLLCLRDAKPGIPYPGRWDLLGGQLEMDENPEDCIRRELLEEIEYELERPELYRISNLPDRFEFTYWCLKDIDIASTPLHEGQRLQWFSRRQLLAMPDERMAYVFKSILTDFFDEVPADGYRADGSSSLALKRSRLDRH
jgi:8-oxo-dGTP diphosphatase